MGTDSPKKDEWGQDILSPFLFQEVVQGHAPVCPTLSARIGELIEQSTYRKAAVFTWLFA